ncbi:MAG: DUF6577 family protein, partial [bacterium]
FTAKDVVEFFHAHDETLPETTIHWRIYHLKKQGVIESLGRGLYKIANHTESKITFKPNFTRTHKNLFTKIKKQFPLASFCLWPVRCLHEFMVHLPTINWTIVEVEKDIAESVYSFLREKKQDVYLNPDTKTMNQAVAYDREALIIKNMVSESPLIQEDKISYPSLEKILVDVFSDKIIFNIYQGSELSNIFSNTFEKYSINLLRLKRYARRRQAWEGIEKIL